MSKQFAACADCGMILDPNEYHPYAACLMFKSCKSSEVVMKNLHAVQLNGVRIAASHVEQMGDRIEPSEIAKRLRAIE